MCIKRVVFCVVSCLILSTATFASAVDLKIKNLEFNPKPAGINGPRIQLGINQSYRVIVTIQKTTALPNGASFMVRTECIRNGNSVVIGEARVGDSKGWNIYACYDIYPGEASSGDCLLRTTVDADNEITESDESAISNVWDRQATLSRP